MVGLLGCWISTLGPVVARRHPRSWGSSRPYSGRVPSASTQLDRIERLCRGSLTAKALREQVLDEVRRVVHFDGHLFGLTDPVTRVATSPLADVPMLPWPRLPELIRARYLTRLNRWDVLLEDGITAASLVDATDGHPEESLLWSQVQRGLGVSDTAVAPFADRYGSWGLLDLWRIDGTFDASDRRFLASLSGVSCRGSGQRWPGRSWTRTSSCCRSGRRSSYSIRTCRCARRRPLLPRRC